MPVHKDLSDVKDEVDMDSDVKDKADMDSDVKDEVDMDSDSSSDHDDYYKSVEEAENDIPSSWVDEDEYGINIGEPGISRVSRVYLPTMGKDKNIKLECDESAYKLHHAIKTGLPCLSFDVVPDKLGDNRANTYPLTMTLLAGTQNSNVHCNSLLVLKLSNMHKNKERSDDEDSDEGSDSDSSEDEETKPVLDCVSVRHAGCVNRVKVTALGDTPYAASWSELDKVHIWDLSRPVAAVNDPQIKTKYIQDEESPPPKFTFSGHLTEGFALQWSPTEPGVLASGDCKGNIHLWKPLPGGSWHVDQKPYKGHTESVEDIQWSPNESNVMVTCSIDKTIKVWDTRIAPDKACMLTKQDAHDNDVNVLGWNPVDPFILSGGDDAKLRIWDLRKFPEGDAICTFKHHTAPITSVDWHPTDRSVFAASGEDHQVTQWDLAVERDKDMEKDQEVSPELLELPPQLLFIHQGQREVKEIHWHKQMPGVLTSTARTGINVIRTLSI